MSEKVLTDEIFYFYHCEICDYTTDNLCDYKKHLNTIKHKNNENVTNVTKKSPKIAEKYNCNCGKVFNNRTSLWRHKKICNQDSNNTIKEVDNEIVNYDNNTSGDLIKCLINENKEIKEMILEIVKNGLINNTNNTTNNSYNTTNSNNKAFNLNFFLNETCKNAMNITDFIDSIKLQLSDLIEVGELGYVDGISKIIVKNLNNLDETERPIHCTDKKRETMYIKDAGEWSKEDEKKSKLKKIINMIANKNIKLLPQFREKFPEYNNSSSKISDVHDKLVIEVMETDDDKKDKIIHNISKATIITLK